MTRAHVAGWTFAACLGLLILGQRASADDNLVSVAPEQLSPYMNSIPPSTDYLCVGTGPTNRRLHPDRAPHTQLAMQDGVVLFSGTAPQRGLNFTLTAGDLVYRNQMSTLGSPEPPPQVGTAGLLLQRPWEDDNNPQTRRMPWSEARWHQGEDISWQGHRSSNSWLGGLPYWRYVYGATSRTAISSICGDAAWSDDEPHELFKPVVPVIVAPGGYSPPGLPASINLQLSRGIFQLSKPTTDYWPKHSNPPPLDGVTCSALFREPWFHGRGLDPAFGHEASLPVSDQPWRLADDYYPNYLNIYPFEKLELDGGRLALKFERSATWPRESAEWDINSANIVGGLVGAGKAGTLLAQSASDEYGNQVLFDRVPQYGWETDYKVPHRGMPTGNSNAPPGLRAIPQSWRLPHKRLRTVQLRDKNTPDPGTPQWTIVFIYEHPESDRISATDTAVAMENWTETLGRQPDDETWREWKSIYSHLPQSDWNFGRLPELNDETTLLTVQAYRSNPANPVYQNSLVQINGAPFQDDFSVWASTVGQDGPQHRVRLGKRVDPSGQHFGGDDAECPGLCDMDDDGDGLIDEDCEGRERGAWEFRDGVQTNIWGEGCPPGWLGDDNESGGTDDEIESTTLTLDNTDPPGAAFDPECPGHCADDDDGDGMKDEDTNGYLRFLDVSACSRCQEVILDPHDDSVTPQEKENCFLQDGGTVDERWPRQTHLDTGCPNPLYWNNVSQNTKMDPFALYDDDEDGLMDEDSDQNPLLVDIRSISDAPEGDDELCRTGRYPFVPNGGSLPAVSASGGVVNQHCRDPLSEEGAADPWVYQVQYVYARSNPYWLLKGRDVAGRPISHDAPVYEYYPNFSEPFTDANQNGIRDATELFVDVNQNGHHDVFPGNVHADCLPSPQFRAPSESDGGRPLQPSEIHLIKRVVRMREDAFNNPYNFTEQTWLYRYNDLGFLKAVFDPGAVLAIINANSEDDINEPDDVIRLSDAHEVAGQPLIMYASQWYTYYNPYVEPILDENNMVVGVQQCYERPPVVSFGSTSLDDFDDNDPSNRLPSNACDGQIPWITEYREEIHTDPDCSSFMQQDCGWCYARYACGQACPDGACEDEECYCTQSASHETTLRRMGITGAEPRLRKYMVKTARVRGGDGEMHLYRFDYLGAESSIYGTDAVLSYADARNITVVDEMVEQGIDEYAGESGRSDFYIYEDDFRLDLDSGPPSERYIAYGGGRYLYSTSGYLYNPSKVKTRRVVVMNYYGIALSDRLILTPGFEGDQTSLVDNQQFELLNNRGQAKHVFDPSWVAGWRDRGLSFIKNEGRVLTQLFGGPEGWQRVLAGIARGSGGGELYAQQCHTPQVLNEVPVQRVKPEQLSIVMATKLFEKTAGQETTLPATHATYYRAGAQLSDWLSDPADTIGESVCVQGEPENTHVPSLEVQDSVAIQSLPTPECPPSMSCTPANDGVLHTYYDYDTYNPSDPDDEQVRFKWQWTEAVPVEFGGTGNVALQIEFYDRSGRLRFVGRGAGTSGSPHPAPTTPFLVNYIGYDELGRQDVSIIDVDYDRLPGSVQDEIGDDFDTIAAYMLRIYEGDDTAAHVVSQNSYNDSGILVRRSVGVQDTSGWTSVDHTDFKVLANRTILHGTASEKPQLEWQDPYIYLLEYEHTQDREVGTPPDLTTVTDVYGVTSVTVLDRSGRFVEERKIARHEDAGVQSKEKITDFGWGISLADYTHDSAIDGWTDSTYRSDFWTAGSPCFDSPNCFGNIGDWVDNGHTLIPKHPWQADENASWPPAPRDQIITLSRSLKHYTQPSTLKPTEDIIFSDHTASPPTDGSPDTRQLVTHYLYDLEDRIARQQDANGAVTRLLYDTKRRPTKIFRGSIDGCSDWFPPIYSTSGDDMLLVEHRLYNDGTSACEHSPMAGSDDCTTITENKDWPYDANRLVRVRRFADDAEACESPYEEKTRSRDEQYEYDWRGRVIMARELAVGYAGPADPATAATVSVTTTVYDNLDRPLVVATWPGAAAPELDRVRAWQESDQLAPDMVISECLTRGPGNLPLSLSQTIYDELGRVFEQRQYDPRSLAGTGGAKRYSFTRTYRDELDRVLREATPDGVTTFEYDSLGRVVSMSTWSKEEPESGGIPQGNPDGVELTRTQTQYDIFGNAQVQVHFEFKGSADEESADTGAGVPQSGGEFTFDGYTPPSDYIVTYTYNWYDHALRLMATANWGTAGPDGLTSGTPPAYDSGNPPEWGTDGDVYDYYFAQGGARVHAVVSRFGYDLAGRRIWTQDAKGIVTRIWYDLLGRTLLAAENWNGGSELTPDYAGPSRYTAYHYSSGGLQDMIVAILPPDPGQQFTPSDITWTTSAKKVTRVSIDGGTVPTQVTKLVYGADVVNDSNHGETISTATNLVRQIRYPKDETSGDASATDTLTFTYTPDGSVATRTDQRGVRLDFLNDLPDDCASCVPGPAGSPSRVQVTYSDDGSALVDPLRAVDHLLFRYDSRGMLTSAELYGDTTTPDTLQSKVTYTYDPLGNLLSETLDPTPGSTTSMERTTAYGWSWKPVGAGAAPDANGPGRMRLSSMVYNANATAARALNFSYNAGSTSATWTDDTNRMTGIDGADDAPMISYRRSGGGTPLSKTWGTSAVTLDFASGGFDRFGRISRMDFANAATPFEYLYNYDKNGNRTSAHITQAEHDNDRSYTYAYDRLDRLINAERGVLDAGVITTPPYSGAVAVGRQWTLDLLGSWSGDDTQDGLIEYDIASAGGGYEPGSDTPTHNESHATNAVNEITTRTFNDGSGAVESPFAYDDAGNLAFDGRQHYKYDAWNRVVAVYDKGGLSVDAGGVLSGTLGDLIATYEYDALGRRIAKHVSRPIDPDEYFYYDGNRIVEHYKGSDASLSLHRQYVWGFDYIDELIGYYADGGSTPRFVLQDASYNVIATATNTEGITQQYSYEPYGDMFAAEDVLSDSGIPITIPVELPSQAIDLSTPLGFQGHMHDWEFGKIHMRVRLYDPVTGRPLQRDPYQTALVIVSALRSNAQTAMVFANLRAGGQYTNGMSLYEYAGSNPINHRDPSGLSWTMWDETEELADDLTGQKVYALAAINEGVAWASLGLQTAADIALSLIPGYGIYDAYKSVQIIRSGRGGLLDYLNVGLGGINAASSLFKAAKTLGKAAALFSKAKRGGKFVGAFRAYTYGNMRHNLKVLSGWDPGELFQAHHLLPKKFEFQFNRAGIANIHKPVYGTWWSTTVHRSKAFEYNKAWEDFFDKFPNATRNDVLDKARELARHYELEVLFDAKVNP
ncbi:MAG: hypothetical protein J5J06_04070 [Phycisphaerae bacterium]|nr:hypothetical protein [Phycisphaerae bacterium]